MSFSDQFKGKVIAITGAAQGIGYTTALVLASRGASLSLADIQSSTLDKARDTILSQCTSIKVFSQVVDVRSAEQVESWIKATVSHFGRLDGAANIAGIVPRSIGSDAGLVENISPDEWDSCLGVNLTGVMHCMKYQLRVMAEDSAIVNASSIAGLVGREKDSIYTATKHGVIGLTRSAAKEVGGRGVRVNAICPGRIETAMSKLAQEAFSKAGAADEYTRETLSDVAMRRKGQPEEVAKLIAFLLSEESSYITGNAISIDGGWNC
ncbi:ABA4 protein [Emericellopsis atlantica]|uniref:ABA4 protein n=1 Tax=Emericellopsis atlantica TaxID=2614577 RepID=A0A9P7ZVH3_9HYPO|nr:ABA4 protein [Emericellopsis atlantica]KAG9258497.1 ABA4 protein [Emericellopsis atlantica]